MKRLENVKDFAKAVNFGKYPVLSIDISNYNPDYCRGCKVKIDDGNYSNGQKRYIKAELIVYKSDNPVFDIDAKTVALTSTTSYNDLIKDIEYANAPIIKENSEFVIAVYDSIHKIMYQPYLIKTGKIHENCIDPIEIEKVICEEYKEKIGR